MQVILLFFSNFDIKKQDYKHSYKIVNCMKSILNKLAACIALYTVGNFDIEIPFRHNE